MTTSSASTLLGDVTIGARYNGPETTANGGYAAGSLAAFLPEPAEVTLRLPPPLDHLMEVHRAADGEGVELRDGEQLIATGRAIEPFDLEPPVRPTYEEGRAAAELHAGRGVRHPMSDCFVCSPYREDADGLGLCPGPLDEAKDIGAAALQPDQSFEADGGEGIVALEVVWGALDCSSYTPSMWVSNKIALLGRLAVQRERDIEVGEQLSAVGWPLGVDGRKIHTASALIGGNGEIVASARATWIELKG